MYISVLPRLKLDASTLSYSDKGSSYIEKRSSGALLLASDHEFRSSINDFIISVFV